MSRENSRAIPHNTWLVLLVLVHFSLAAPPYAGHGGYALQQLIEGNGLGSVNSFTVPSEEFTVEMWVQNPTAAANNERVFSLHQSTTLIDFQLAANNGQVTVRIDGGTVQPIGTNNVITDPGTAVHLALVVTQGAAADTSEVELFLDGAPRGSITYPAFYTETRSTAFLYPGWKAGSTERNLFGVIDDVRFWSSARTEAQIANNMDRVLEADDHPDLVAYYRFTDGVFVNGVLVGEVPNESNDALSIGDLEPKPNTDGDTTFNETQLEIKPGYGLPTYTGLAVEAKPGLAFEFPLVGGDSDGDELVFVLDAIPAEVEFFTGTLESVGATPLAVDSTFQLNENGAIIGRIVEETDLDVPLEILIEYHAVEYFVVTNGDSSLKTEAYMTLTETPFNFIPLFIVGGSVIALGGLVGLGTALSKRKKSNSGYSYAKNVKGGGRRGSGGSGVSAASTVDQAIAMLLDEFDVPALNRYVGYMIRKGIGEPALALALAVEQAAVGLEADVYLEAVENVGAAMTLTGRNEAIDEVKTARRTTMAMRGTKKKVTEGQLQSKRMRKVRTTMKQQAKKLRVADSGGSSVWNRETIRQTAGQLQPISAFMDNDSEAFRVSVDSTMAFAGGQSPGDWS